MLARPRAGSTPVAECRIGKKGLAGRGIGASTEVRRLKMQCAREAVQSVNDPTGRVCNVRHIWFAEVRGLFARGRKRLGAGVGALEGEIDGTWADGPGAVANAAVDGEQVAGAEFDGAVVKIDEQAAFEYEKGFIGVGMGVPVIRLGHGGDANFVVVDFGDGMIVVVRRRG